MTNTPDFYIPNRQTILNLKVGDKAIDCFGNMSEVVEIFGRGVDVNVKWYVCYTTRLGENSTVSGSMKEGELVRTVELSKYYTSHELDMIEREMEKC